MAAMTVKLGYYIWDMTMAMMLDRITQTDQSGQVGLTGQHDNSGRTGQR